VPRQLKLAPVAQPSRADAERLRRAIEMYEIAIRLDMKRQEGPSENYWKRKKHLYHLVGLRKIVRRNKWGSDGAKREVA
jgi:hypothetical protein